MLHYVLFSRFKKKVHTKGIHLHIIYLGFFACVYSFCTSESKQLLFFCHLCMKTLFAFSQAVGDIVTQQNALIRSFQIHQFINQYNGSALKEHLFFSNTLQHPCCYKEFCMWSIPQRLPAVSGALLSRCCDLNSKDTTLDLKSAITLIHPFCTFSLGLWS